MQLEMMNYEGTVMIADFTVADGWLLAPVLSAGVDPTELVLAVLVTGHPLKTLGFTLQRKPGGDGVVPPWAQHEFMRRPLFWPGGVCALAKTDQPLLARELSYLRLVGGCIHHFIGNAFGPPVAEGAPLSLAGAAALYDQGWRVD